MSTTRSVLIFSGYNERGIIAFCRFCKKANIPFAVVAASSNDKILLSSYSQNVIETRFTSKLTLDAFRRYREYFAKTFSPDETIVLPSTEFLNHFLLEERNSLESMGYVIPLCSMSLYQAISDKYSFYLLCRNRGILTPQELSISHCKPPCVVKPKTYFAQDKKTVNPKTTVISNFEELQKCRRTIDTQNTFIQEFVEGKSVYLLFYFGKDRTYSIYSQENFMQQYNGRSIIAAEAAQFHEHSEVQKFTDLFLDMHFTGLVMVETRLKGEKFYMIEANPLIWGPSQLINDANMDLFHRFAVDFGLVNEDRSLLFDYQPKTRYFWLGGILEDLSSGNMITFHNYDRERFFDEYALWLQREVYFREDTVNVFLEELKSCHKRKSL